MSAAPSCSSTGAGPSGESKAPDGYSATPSKGTKWEGANIAQPYEPFGGDFLSVGKFNDDVYPDFIGSSVYFNGPHILFLSKGANKYENVGVLQYPIAAASAVLLTVVLIAVIALILRVVDIRREITQ